MSLFLKNSMELSDKFSKNHYTKSILIDEMLHNPLISIFYFFLYSFIHIFILQVYGVRENHVDSVWLARDCVYLLVTATTATT